MLELLARLLSRDSGPVIVMRSEDADPVLMGPLEAWNSQCGKGA